MAAPYLNFTAMKIKALVSFAGNAIVMGFNETREVNDQLARELIRDGLAVEVAPDPKPAAAFKRAKR
jgi:hypothetical protein